MSVSHDPLPLAGLLGVLDDDTWLATHAHGVAARCRAMALVLGTDRRRREHLAAAAAVHDIGKLMIPQEIVHKPSRLTASETAVMRGHSALGAQALREAGHPEVALIVRHHHERIDGRGYPDGLSDDVIPLESRIIHVADAFDAITSERPYARARSHAEALAELAAHAGTQFDRECVDALCATVAGPVRRPGSGRRPALLHPMGAAEVG